MRLSSCDNWVSEAYIWRRYSERFPNVLQSPSPIERRCQFNEILRASMGWPSLSKRAS